jgi:hypothetical protein
VPEGCSELEPLWLWPQCLPAPSLCRRPAALEAQAPCRWALRRPDPGAQGVGEGTRPTSPGPVLLTSASARANASATLAQKTVACGTAGYVRVTVDREADGSSYRQHSLGIALNLL